MTIEKTTLSNGVRILTRHMPHVRSISTGIWVNVGARDESAAENGLSHFIEHMIFKGTRKRTAVEIAKAFDAIGGQTNAFTAMETTCYHAKVVDHHLEIMVDILADIFRHSIFDAGELERERQVILQEMEMVRDNPEEHIHLLSDHAYWGEHPLGRPIVGKKENIQSFDTDALRDFFHRLYQPERIVIAAAGNVTHQRFVSAIGPHFEEIHAGRIFPARAVPLPREGVFVHEKDLGQVQACLGTAGLPVGDEARFCASLLNIILGGNMSSRLFQEIREKRGLAYNVYAFPASFSDAGMTGVHLATAADDVAEALNLVARELERLCITPVDGDELRDAKAYTAAGLLMAAENVDNQMVRLAQNEIFFGDHLTVREILERIEAVSATEIQDLAQDLISRISTLTLLGPVKSSAAFDRLIGTGRI